MLLYRIRRMAQPLLRAWFRASRGMTIGVRGLVTNAEGEVLLLVHTYSAGWQMPGGGVEWGETVEEALTRELVEEVGVQLTGRPVLTSVHSNHRLHPRDHVVVYRITEWEPCEATSRGEIARTGWFAPDALPEDVTAGTRRRIAEFISGGPADPHW